jgi:hypothetical protein
MGSDSIAYTIWTVVTKIFIIVIEIAICYFLVFKTEWIIGILKLDKGFNQETIPLNMHRSTILSISIIVVGGLLIVDQIPTFLRQLFIYIQEKRARQFNPKIEYSILAGVKILVGVLLITEQRLFVNLIERKRKK